MSTNLAIGGLSSGELKKRLMVLLVGHPGSWKTVLAHGMPRTRTIDFDDGMQSVEWAILAGKLDKKLEEIIYETILATKNKADNINMLDRASDQIDEWLAEEAADPSKVWHTLVIDSASGLNEAAITKGLKENGRWKLSKSWDGWKDSGWNIRPMRKQDWGAAGYLQKKFIEWCRSLNKNLIVTAHSYVNSTDDGTILGIEPSLIGANRQSVPGIFDEVWFSSVEGTRNNPQAKIQTNAGNKREAKSRLGCLDSMETLDYYAIRKKVAEFYKVDEESLWTGGGEPEENLAV